MLSLVYVCNVHAQSKVYHVSTFGSDRQPGTSDLPFRTLKKAGEVLRPGDTCMVYPGVYRETFRPRYNGRPGKPIVVMATHKGEAVVSGFDIVDNWKKEKDQIYTAKVAARTPASGVVMINNQIGVEARFPNKMNLDPFDPEGAEIKATLPTEGEGEIRDNPFRFFTDAIPPSWKGETLQDARVWVLAQFKWSAWTSKVKRYDPEEKSLYFKPFPEDQSFMVSANFNPNYVVDHYGKGIFYLFGSKVLLDAPYEWFYDKTRKALSVVMPGKESPQKGMVEFRQRTTLIDLRDRKYWEVSGFSITGGNIDMDSAENCVIADCNIRYFWHNLPEQSPYAESGNSGIILGGENNIIRNSELAFSAGNAITLGGHRNKVVNNLIHHHNYSGSIIYGIIKITGTHFSLTHNTIHSAGRDCVKLENGAGGIVAYNNIYNPGLLCEDVGVIYAGGRDYENVQVHHNYIHNNKNQKESVLGIYFDNFSANVQIHHNVVWGIRESIRLNRPGNYEMVYNNIGLEINNAYGRWDGPKTQFGSMVFNNIFKYPTALKPEIYQQDNLIGIYPFDTLRYIPEITVARATPAGNTDFPAYIGAFAPSKDGKYWTAGHNFEARIEDKEVKSQLPFFRNYIQNGSFEWKANRQKSQTSIEDIEHWTTEGEVQLNYSPGFNVPGPDTRNAIHGNSLWLKGDTVSVSQRVDQLREGAAYVFSVYARINSEADIKIRVHTGEGMVEAGAAEFTEMGKWKLLTLSFEARGPVRVTVLKSGRGNVYLDNIGLTPIIL